MIRGAGNISTSIVIFGWIFLGLVTAVPSGDGWWTSSNVLFGMNTPVYSFRSDINSEFGHKLILQENAMVNYKNSRLFHGSRSTRAFTANEEIQSNEGLHEPNPSSIVYAKIVVIVDNGIWKREGKDLTRLLHYLVGVWNGVDLKFRDLENPTVRLNIAGVIIEEREGSIPFLSEFKYRERQVNLADVAETFAKFMETDGSYWSSHFHLYHTAVLMTSLDEQLGRGRRGAHVSRPMCTDIYKKGPPGRVVFSDDGGWSRITRELTYFLGSSFQTSVYEDVGRKCAYEQSVVYSGFRNNYSPEMPMWSNCLLDSFKKLFNSEESRCLYEKPDLKSPLPRALPGKILSCDATCDRMAGDRCCPIEPEEAVCARLICERSEWSWSWTPYKRTCFPSKIYAPDGTPCGGGKICFRRKCVVEKDME